MSEKLVLDSKRISTQRFRSEVWIIYLVVHRIRFDIMFPLDTAVTERKSSEYRPSMTRLLAPTAAKSAAEWKGVVCRCRTRVGSGDVEVAL